MRAIFSLGALEEGAVVFDISGSVSASGIIPARPSCGFVVFAVSNCSSWHRGDVAVQLITVLTALLGTEHLFQGKEKRHGRSVAFFKWRSSCYPSVSAGLQPFYDVTFAFAAALFKCAGLWGTTCAWTAAFALWVFVSRRFE